jgi:hypothetical protein
VTFAQPATPLRAEALLGRPGERRSSMPTPAAKLCARMSKDLGGWYAFDFSGFEVVDATADLRRPGSFDVPGILERLVLEAQNELVRDPPPFFRGEPQGLRKELTLQRKTSAVRLGRRCPQVACLPLGSSSPPR